MRMRLLLAAPVLTFAAGVALASPVRADDCASQVHSIQDVSKSASIQDCLRTGQTFGVAIGAVVAGTGVVIAVVGLPGKIPTPPPRPAIPQQAPVQRREPEPQPQHADPCFEQQVRYTTAQTGARTTFSALQTLRTQRAYLDELWENTRATGYANAVIDVAMIASSVWKKPVASLLSVELLEQTAYQKFADTVLKALGKGLANNLVKHLEDQHIDWQDLLTKVGDARTKSLATDLIKQQLAKLEYDRAAAEMAGTGKLPDPAAIEKDFAKPISDTIGNLLSIASMAASTFKASEKLGEIRRAISEVDDHIFTAEARWESIVSEMDLAHDSLNRCRDLHGPAPS